MFAAAHILSIGNRAHRPSYVTAEDPPHLVIVGGPGQGKTTIGQLISQVYRAALLYPSPQLPQEVLDLLKAMRNSLGRVDMGQPVNRRWPVRIELAAYADKDAKRDISLLRYIADHVSSRSSDDIKAVALREWLKCWPWLLVLDGLDEVPSQKGRDSLMRRISDFFIEAAQTDCDLLVVATTRPQGYTGEFSADRYEHITLSPLEPSFAAGYALRLAEVQHASDPDLLKKVVNRTNLASQEASTARLMRTPLQVTIMSLLLENRERAPQARYALFEEYYKAIYKREATKPGAIGTLLEILGPHVDALHNRVGLLLQVKAEHEGESDAALPQQELRELAVLHLAAEGYTDQEADRLAEQVLKAVTQRLVLIVPKALDEVGFEVRSIQEFMAARDLISGRDEAILSRLKLLVPSAHWRNTWLFAAGGIYSDRRRRYQRRVLISLVEDTDSYSVVNVVVAPGADLALDLLDDDLTVGMPELQRALVRHALTLLRCPPDDDLRRRAGALYRCTSDEVVRAAVDQAIGDAISGSLAQQSAAYQLLQEWQGEAGSLGLRARQVIARGSIALAGGPHLKRWDRQEPDQLTPFFVITNSVIEEEDLSPRHRALVQSLIRSSVMNVQAEMNSALDEVFSIPECVTVFAKIVLALGAKPASAAKFRGILRNWSSRRPVGAEVLSKTPFPDDEGPHQDRAKDR